MKVWHTRFNNSDSSALRMIARLQMLRTRHTRLIR